MAGFGHAQLRDDPNVLLKVEDLVVGVLDCLGAGAQVPLALGPSRVQHAHRECRGDLGCALH